MSSPITASSVAVVSAMKFAGNSGFNSGIDVSQAEEANAGDPVDRPRQLLAACLGTASDKVGNGRPVQPWLAQVQHPPLLLAQPAAGFRQQLPSRPCFCG